MCGIAGIILSDSMPVDIQPALARMRDALNHRGPDDNGLVLFPNTTGGFVNTRLAILDLSPAGHQPMSTPDGRFFITFNGEIYNFEKLRDELLDTGVQLKSHSDTEVVLRLYERDGPACVNKLLGMFAFAIWDAKERTCFLARDPLGIKPLYYSAFPRDLIFASEMRTFLQSGRIPKEISAEALYTYFLNGTVSEPRTLVEGVRILPAGHYLLWHDDHLTLQKYWELSFATSWPNGKEPAEYLREALLESVKRHFVSDVPVGVFLSGGIDSTAIVALARETGYEDLRTFNISLDEPKLDEGEIAKKAGKHFHTTHTEWRLTGATGAALLDEFIDKIDRPTIDGFNTFCVSKVAHDAGLKVVLSGLGGDELFGGYQSFHRIPQMVELARGLSQLPALKQGLGRLLQQVFPSSPFRRVGAFFEETPTVESAYQAVRGVFTRGEAAALCGHYLGPDVLFQSTTVRPSVAQESMADAVTELEIERYMRNQLLRDSDVFSMAWSLELRVPFVDRALIDAATSIPAKYRVQHGKRLLLQAVPEIPEWIAKRKKQGFVFPFERWMKEEWRAILSEKGSVAGVRLASWYQKWSIFVLEKWLEAVGMELRPVAR
jgi:asparagine synthase (glutamine-hydrolysing)